MTAPGYVNVGGAWKPLAGGPNIVYAKSLDTNKAPFTSISGGAAASNGDWVFEKDTTDLHSGAASHRFALRLKAGKTGTALSAKNHATVMVSIYLASTGLVNGTKYRIKFWMKADPRFKVWEPFIGVSPGPVNPTGTKFVTFPQGPPTAAWQEYSVDYTYLDRAHQPSGENGSIVIYIPDQPVGTAFGPVLWLDDFSIEDLDHPGSPAYVKVGGAWKAAVEGWVRVGADWKKMWP